jgi:hypothetical protein
VSNIPAEFEDAITIIWPDPQTRAQLPGAGVLPGWGVRILRDGEQVTTVTEVIVHVSSGSLIWAELTMCASADGHPIYAGPPSDGNAVLGTFPYQVTEMLTEGMIALRVTAGDLSLDAARVQLGLKPFVLAGGHE